MLEVLDDPKYAKKNTVDNETIFHLLQVATGDGSAAHLVDAHESKKDGNAAFASLISWYEGDDLTTETAEDVRSKLDKLSLNTKTSASEYINMFQLLTKQLDELGESYTPSKTVQIFLSQITDPDFENTRELCVENKYRIDECIERIRSKERRVARGRTATKFRTLSIRRSDVNEPENPVDMGKYMNTKGYYSIPRGIWHNLDAETQERVKKYNGDLRKSRRRSGGGVSSNQHQGDRIVTNRRAPTNEGDNDINPSPTKRMRTVQFRDQDDATESEDKQSEKIESLPNVINQRRGDILTFQVRDSPRE